MTSKVRRGWRCTMMPSDDSHNAPKISLEHYAQAAEAICRY